LLIKCICNDFYDVHNSMTMIDMIYVCDIIWEC